MAKIEKAIERLSAFPKDFTWDELISILGHFGFKEIKTGKTGGARRKFSDAGKQIISLHKPHPGNILKRYQLKAVVAALKEKGVIKDD